MVFNIKGACQFILVNLVLITPTLASVLDGEWDVTLYDHEPKSKKVLQQCIKTAGIKWSIKGKKWVQTTVDGLDPVFNSTNTFTINNLVTNSVYNNVDLKLLRKGKKSEACLNYKKSSLDNSIVFNFNIKNPTKCFLKFSPYEQLCSDNGLAFLIATCTKGPCLPVPDPGTEPEPEV